MMSESITTTESTDDAPDGLWRDGQPFDGPRMATTLDKLRQNEKDLKAQLVTMRAGYRAITAGQPVDPNVQLALATTEAGEQVAAYRAAFEDISKALGVKAAADPSAILQAAKAARLSGAVGDAIHRAGADPVLTRAVLNLDTIDPSSATLADDLGELVAQAVDEHPALRGSGRQAPSGPSGVPMPGGSTAMAPLVTHEQLQYMTPEAVVRLRESGALAHLNVGGGRK